MTISASSSGTRGTGLFTSQIRQIARLYRAQVKRLINELRAEEVVNPPGRGRHAAWSYRDRGGKWNLNGIMPFYAPLNRLNGIKNGKTFLDNR